MSKVVLLSLVLIVSSALGSVTSWAKSTHVLLQTTQGNIELALADEKAPITVKNFLHYVNSGFYTETIFHRVISGFMIQGGGFTPDMQEKAADAPAIQNESANGLANLRGTIAMARTADVNSATSQFFINVVDNAFLDGNSTQPGYAVFGNVVNGMAVVDNIAKASTQSVGAYQDVPSQPIIILSAKVLP